MQADKLIKTKTKLGLRIRSKNSRSANRDTKKCFYILICAPIFD